MPLLDAILAGGTPTQIDTCLVASSVPVKGIVSGSTVTESNQFPAVSLTKVTLADSTVIYLESPEPGVIAAQIQSTEPCTVEPSPVEINLPTCPDQMPVGQCPGDVWDVNVTNTNPIEIELGGYEACYNGTPAHVEIVRGEDQSFIKYIAHLKDGSGTIVDPAVATQIGQCAEGNKESKVICKCDDVNGDGTLYESYVEYYEVSVSNSVVTSTLLGTFTDESFTTTYTPTNPIDCDSIGVDAEECWNSIILTGTDTFSPPFLTQSLSILAYSGSPTYTGSDGNTVTMIVSESKNFDTTNPTNLNFSQILIDANGGSVKVSYSILK